MKSPGDIDVESAKMILPDLWNSACLHAVTLGNIDNIQEHEDFAAISKSVYKLQCQNGISVFLRDSWMRIFSLWYLFEFFRRASNNTYSHPRIRR